MAEPLVRLEDFDSTGRGQAATRNIAAGEVVLEVALEDCWTAAIAAGSPELGALRGGFEQGTLSEVDMIALHLLVHRAAEASGPRAEHVRQMPSSYDVPLVWTKEQVESLSGSSQHKLAAQQQQDAEASYWRLDSDLQDLGGEAAGLFEKYTVTLDGYLWARAAIQTRSTRLEIATADGTESLQLVCLPAGGADQFNHSPEVEGASFRLTADGRLQVLSLLPVKAGEQVFISYGQGLSTAQLLFTYGFAYPEALAFNGLGTPLPADFVPVTHPVPEECEDPAEAAREGLVLEGVSALEDEEHSAWELEAGDDDSIQFVFRLSAGNPVPNCWLVANRMLKLTDEEVVSLKESDELMGKVLAGRPVSPANEEAALDAMLLEVMGRLDSHGGVSSKLLRRLSSTGDVSERDRLAANLRMVEASILQAAVDSIQALQASGVVTGYVF